VNCPEARELLSAYLDGYLGPEEKTAMEEHLAGCPYCAMDLAGIKETISLVHSLENDTLEPPPDFAEQVMNAVYDAAEKAKNPEPARRRRFLKWLPLAAAAVVVLAFWQVIPLINTNQVQVAQDQVAMEEQRRLKQDEASSLAAETEPHLKSLNEPTGYQRAEIEDTEQAGLENAAPAPESDQPEPPKEERDGEKGAQVENETVTSPQITIAAAGAEVQDTSFLEIEAYEITAEEVISLAEEYELQWLAAGQSVLVGASRENLEPFLAALRDQGLLFGEPVTLNLDERINTLLDRADQLEAQKTGLEPDSEEFQELSQQEEALRQSAQTLTEWKQLTVVQIAWP